MNDKYLTLDYQTEAVLFKEKNSKFFGYCFPIIFETEVKLIIDDLRKKHFGAGHFCYAYQIGTEKIQFRTNDDGEPNNTAGLPIYGQIQSFKLTNILVIVIRYFGGTKLGVGGLILAYKSTAQLAIQSALIVEKTIKINHTLYFEYKNINKIMRIVKEKNIEIVSQKMNLSCEVVIAIRKRDAIQIFDIFNSLQEIKIKILN